MEVNTEAAKRSHGSALTEHQEMASQVIAQALSLSLSIRELIRQGYLFGGHVLVRPLAERVAILLYLYHYPEEIEKWKSGWQHREAPGLAKMFKALQEKREPSEREPEWELTKAMNSLVHGKPDSAPWNFVLSEEGSFAHASAKILSRPDLCDNLCGNVIPWLTIVPSMMNHYFPNAASR